MAIAFDSISTDVQTSVSALTISHTPAGTPTIAIQPWQRRTPGTVAEQSYAGVAMTEDATANTGTEAAVSLSQLAAPTAGTQNCVMRTTSLTARMIGGAITYTGTLDADPTDGQVTASGTGTSSTLTIASRAGDMVVSTIVITGANASAGLVTGVASMTTRYVLETGGSAGNAIAGACADQVGASVVTMTYNWTNSLEFAHAATNIRAAAEGGAAPISPYYSSYYYRSLVA